MATPLTLRWEYNILNYGVVHRRKQEPSIPSIEQLFAKLKTLLRTAANLCAAIRQAFTRFTATECRNYLAAAGYDAYDPN